ncbi:hypothetical protein C1X89_30965 [Pseudomonas sp. GP01-A8]|nr:hypothetical protein C1X90_28485 [Pseudomonas sp. GP01-A9]PMU19863.1 hypothetical protein C1X88_31055 [Pseudomonas sp. GP01-A13]PMU32628.1 hypothetical protein C1X89_30965 [Pseudomonas sp. GP01-A8]PMU46480.1 hypothetical protein C1X87_25500 [Pseudomonas sp. GP01-A14]PMU47580.1 hypothetical protein C1X85_31960 [Pseudomonas sp. GP01-A6]PMU59027.1 hypothetical protein C1X86_30760 [Pseudomonas sp. GP01-A3]PMU68103.1 hypothetical protein C1X84_28675 [Pseudomonas sp. GP01-A1]PMU72031.1 hypothet
MWERACSRKRWFSWQIRRLTHRLREQAHSHTSPLLQGSAAINQAAYFSFFRLSMSITNRYFTSPLSMRS